MHAILLELIWSDRYGNVQGRMTGDLSLMCPEFVQSFFAGMAASGAITTALRFFTEAAFENSRDGLRKGAKATSEGSQAVTADLAAGGIKSLPNPLVEEDRVVERLNNKQLLHQNMDYALDMFLIYVLTLSIFPGFLEEDTGSHSLGSL